ncbi:MAG: hypothetical protein IM600_12130 [Bacteroidetes bacterium]|nr:hypothetical protein [Bacteroidota bacterium]
MKILKTLTILAYLLIPINGEHIGGPFVLFLLLWLGDSNFWPTIGTLLIFISIFLFAYVTFRPKQHRDKILIPIISVVLIFPFVKFYKQTLHFFDSTNVLTSALVFSIFIVLTITVRILTLKQQNKQANT